MVFLHVGLGTAVPGGAGHPGRADALAVGATAAFVDGRGSRLGVGRMPLAGAGALAA
jgi:hypothetical protein